jgi:hypothetical protein
MQYESIGRILDSSNFRTGSDTRLAGTRTRENAWRAGFLTVKTVFGQVSVGQLPDAEDSNNRNYFRNYAGCL